MLTGPSSATVRSRARSTSADSRTSVGRERPPTSSAAAADVSGFFSQIATFAPKAANPLAMPRPIPEPPPVTTATRSVRSTAEGSIDTMGQYNRFLVVGRDVSGHAPGKFGGYVAEN